jgi:hypothetical protein
VCGVKGSVNLDRLYLALDLSEDRSLSAVNESILVISTVSHWLTGKSLTRKTLSVIHRETDDRQR